MLHSAIPASLLALAAPALAAAGDSMAQLDGVAIAQVTVRERVIIRLPRMAPAQSMARAAVPAPVRYKEKKGPKCVDVADMGGAMIVEPGAVDLVMEGGKRLRARLDDDCGPMDFYSGFYLRPAADGRVCAKRDVIRMRSGASCEIATFRTLLPVR
ncbi:MULTISPECIES: hypothetical protein [unclassified Sphingomonas]|mgnify:CR=1 FL=1|jgi:hypothetical protein|uniref:hypothetical protein n=1 Tax=unclassified Sphingomonas TaxID=196159 RepID=UPI0025DFAD21|nr:MULTISPECIES: hypothetical protein [unclassified Sphingomonas]